MRQHTDRIEQLDKPNKKLLACVRLAAQDGGVFLLSPDCATRFDVSDALVFASNVFGSYRRVWARQPDSRLCSRRKRERERERDRERERGIA